jgi:hypothetical protein
MSRKSLKYLLCHKLLRHKLLARVMGRQMSRREQPESVEVRDNSQHSEIDFAADRAKAAFANDYTLRQGVYNAYLDVVKGVVERAGDRAELIIKAAGAIGTIYTGVLALTFVADNNKSVKLPPSGIVPAIFLGISIVCAAASIAYVTRKKPSADQDSTSTELPLQGKPEPSDFYSAQIERLAAFVSWGLEPIYSKRRLLHFAIFSLGAGVIFLPIPYLDIPSQAVWIGAPIAVLLVFLIPTIIDQRIESRKRATH